MDCSPPLARPHERLEVCEEQLGIMQLILDRLYGPIQKGLEALGGLRNLGTQLPVTRIFRTVNVADAKVARLQTLGVRMEPCRIIDKIIQIVGRVHHGKRKGLTGFFPCSIDGESLRKAGNPIEPR